MSTILFTVNPRVDALVERLAVDKPLGHACYMRGDSCVFTFHAEIECREGAKIGYEWFSNDGQKLSEDCFWAEPGTTVTPLRSPRAGEPPQNVVLSVWFEDPKIGDHVVGVY